MKYKYYNENGDLYLDRDNYVFDFCDDSEARMIGLPTLHEDERMDVDITIDVNGHGFWYAKDEFGDCGIYTHKPNGSNWENMQWTCTYMFLLEYDIPFLRLPDLNIGEIREIGILVKYKSTDKN